MNAQMQQRQDKLAIFYAKPKCIGNVIVRKIVSRGYTRYKYHHKGHFARTVGDYNYAELEAMLKINFTYSHSMTEADIKRVEKKWRHKL